MQIPEESEIRRRSYFIWEREGCPIGNDLEHWRRAEAELAAECAGSDRSVTDEAGGSGRKVKRARVRKAGAPT